MWRHERAFVLGGDQLVQACFGFRLRAAKRDPFLPPLRSARGWIGRVAQIEDERPCSRFLVTLKDLASHDCLPVALSCWAATAARDTAACAARTSRAVSTACASSRAVCITAVCRALTSSESRAC